MRMVGGLKGPCPCGSGKMVYKAMLHEISGGGVYMYYKERIDMESIWQRPLYQDTGRRPYLFYVAIGARAEELHVSRSRHHVEEMPEGLNLSGLQRPGHSGYMDELLGGVLGKILEGRDRGLYEKAKAAQSWLVLHGEVQKDGTLEYLRNAIGFVQAAVETGAEAVLDPQVLELCPAEEWTQTVFSCKYHPYCHVYAMVSPEAGGTLWLHTRGMRKFGRPDVGMAGVPQGELERAKAVVDQMIYYSAQGAVFNRPAKLHTSLGGACTIHPMLTGDLEDPDYNNEHYRLRWEDCAFEAR